MGIREIARKLDLSPAVVQRLANSLSLAAYIEQNQETKRYALGYRAVVLGAGLRRADNLMVSASAELRQLAREQRVNGYLGVLRNQQAIYLDSVQSAGPIAVRSVPGERALPHSTAMGKVLISELSPEAVDAVVGPAPYFAPTTRTITGRDALMTELVDVRTRGFALSRQENLDGVVSIAAPVRDDSNAIVAALSVAFLTGERNAEGVRAMIGLVLDAAHRCSHSLGCPLVPDLTVEDNVRVD